MSQETQKGVGERLAAGYQQLLSHLYATAEDRPPSEIGEYYSAALERISDLEEMTREELITVSDYLRRDLNDAAAFINSSQQELKDWLNFDIELLEKGVAEVFHSMVDHTRFELERLQQEASRIGEWHTGEVIGMGTLECKGCGEVLHYHKPGHIPPCPKCRGTRFRRLTSQR